MSHAQQAQTPPSREECLQIYNALRSANFPPDKLKGQKGASLVTKVAKATTEEEFVDFAQNNVLPAIKLSPEEQEMLRGGFLITGLSIAAGLCAIAGIVCAHYGH